MSLLRPPDLVQSFALYVVDESTVIISPQLPFSSIISIKDASPRP
jgi:hypothetical protein